MRRSTFLDLCFYLALGAALTAMIYKAINAPPGARVGGDTFVMLSPVFLVMVAKRATRFGGTAVVLGALGVIFSGFALWAALK